MLRSLVVVASLAALSVVAQAEPKPTAPRGVWKVLVRPNAKWVLKNTFEKEHDKVVVENYDVRKVGGADVARLRWTHVRGKGDKADLGGGVSHPTQVAVTDAGLYLLSAEQDDAAITEALKQKPSRSDPPKPYEGTKRNEGRYLHVEGSAGEPTVCMGQGPMPGDGDCDDVCFGEFCVSPAKGVISLDGQWAPDAGKFAQ